ncbi:MAG: TlpA family protein disulfide reductase [Betaproteobacteria bacterium]|nr:TlpA family protein disulfide reductase [Betaproteobacteria bacterium]
MTRSRQVVIVIVVAIAAAVAGYGVHLWRLTGTDRSAEAIMAARLIDLDGRQQPLSQWRGKVLVVNFWATWCAPCRQEIPAFVRLQEKYRSRGLQFVGIAIDQRDQVQVFAREFGINYPVLLGGIDTVEISRQAGNRIGALPFTLVFDRNGQIAAREVGETKETKLDALVQPLL